MSLIIPPEKLTDKNPKIEISTIHRSRGRMGRVDSGDVKNSVLPRWQPRTQGIFSRGLEGTLLGNTLVSAGHVSPRIWEITIKIS